MNRTYKKQKNVGWNEGGFTLMELMVVAFLFPVLFLSIYSLLNMANVISNTNDTFARLNQSAVQTLRNISREIAQTSSGTSPVHLNIATDPNNNSDVRFQIPVDWDNDRDVIGEGVNPQVEWGAYDQAGDARRDAGGNPLNRWVRYHIVNDQATNTNQLFREVLDPNLNLVVGSSRVIANNVSPAAGSFVVTQPANNMVRMTVTLRGTDPVGQGGQARTFQDVPFTNETALRAAVN